MKQISRARRRRALRALRRDGRVRRWQALVRAALDAFGRLDCAHNNAGGSGPGRAGARDHRPQDWNAVIALNLTSVYLCLKHEIPVMQQQGSGAIVNTASGAGLIAVPGSPLRRREARRARTDQDRRDRERAHGRAHQRDLPGQRRHAGAARAHGEGPGDREGHPRDAAGRAARHGRTRSRRRSSGSAPTARRS